MASVRQEVGSVRVSVEVGMGCDLSVYALATVSSPSYRSGRRMNRGKSYGMNMYAVERHLPLQDAGKLET